VTRHVLVAVLCLCAITVPCDVAGVRSPWVVVAGVLAGLTGLLVSAWLADRRAGRL
jgi:hypothetical protein